MVPIHIIGGGPAGASGAIAARQQDREVCLAEKSRFPRHKVCGEFLSPEIAPMLESLGVWSEFLAAGPARIGHLELHFGSLQRRCKLPEPAYGLSRYRFDQLLFERALQIGVEAVTSLPGHANDVPIITAHGRQNMSGRGRRLFGFKAHFEGPVNDAVELYFFSGCYVGINPVEGRITNVCGLGPENTLSTHAFDFDSLVHSFPQLSERLRPLRRSMRWLAAGPLVFQNHFKSAVRPLEYRAGDALSFIDPFTGSGVLSAVLTGSLAGVAAARGIPADAYVKQCRRRMQRPFLFSTLLRTLVANGWAERLAEFVPAPWLVRLTRPRC